MIARRKGTQWFVGAITNEQPRKLQAKLPFLQGKAQATVYCDGPVRTQPLSAGEALLFDLPASGGCAAVVRLLETK